MFFIDEEMTIHVTRGDVAFFTVSAEENGVEYIFKSGDVVRFKAFSKKNCDDVVIQKDFLVEADTTKVNIVLEKGDTKIKSIINKPTDYWYEVELNPLTAPQTIICYDEEGARVLRLYPEGADFREGDDIEPSDIPLVDENLDVNSARPIQNQAVAREFNELRKENAKTLEGYVQFTDIATKDKAGVVKVGGDSAGVKLTADNMLVVASAGVSEIRAMASANRPITPYYLKHAVKEGLVQNDLEWTEAEKETVRNLLGTGEGEGAGAVELTQAEYDNLSEEDKMKDVIYFVTDGKNDENSLVEDISHAFTVRDERCEIQNLNAIKIGKLVFVQMELKILKSLDTSSRGLLYIADGYYRKDIYCDGIARKTSGTDMLFSYASPSGEYVIQFSSASANEVYRSQITYVLQ